MSRLEKSSLKVWGDLDNLPGQHNEAYSQLLDLSSSIFTFVRMVPVHIYGSVPRMRRDLRQVSPCEPDNLSS